MPRRTRNIHLSEKPAELVVGQSNAKKALLIGINNTLMEQDGGGRRSRLTMPHRDVNSMRALLIEHYHYNPNDIVTLIDVDDPKQLQPTRANIRTELRKLVADARRGDRFFFHYSGHVVQTENQDHTEEDGKDECLVPCDSDGVQNLIKDDELHGILVDQLPQGSQLVAILDSCHSGSLLDLEHYRCNRVWVPWMSKGRRKSDPIRNKVQRHNALIVYQHKRISGDRVKQRKTTILNHPLSPLSPERRRRASREMPATPISPVTSPASPTTHKKLARALTKLDINATKGINAIRRSSTWKNSPNTGQQVMKRSKTIKSQFIPWLDIKRAEAAAAEGDTNEEGLQCESPVQQFCNGWCHHNSSPSSPKSPRSPGSPEIISLASCKDSQEAWEDSEGNSMTQRLVEILKQDPHPTMGDLMVTISHKLHDAAMKAHTQTKQYKDKVVRYRKKHPEKCKYPDEGDTDGLNLNDFQDPQLSSRKPLDMRRRFYL